MVHALSLELRCRAVNDLCYDIRSEQFPGDRVQKMRKIICITSTNTMIYKIYSDKNVLNSAAEVHDK